MDMRSAFSGRARMRQVEREKGVGGGGGRPFRLRSALAHERPHLNPDSSTLNLRRQNQPYSVRSMNGGLPLSPTLEHRP